jgi:hypothetical protein
MGESKANKSAENSGPDAGFAVWIGGSYGHSGGFHGSLV